VPVGTVKFSILDAAGGGHGGVRAGFEARAGEIYEISYDREVGVTVVELGTGRTARHQVLRREEY
jgi:hypothetical protein